MKKLLIKWFPKYFNVTNSTFINFEDLEASGNALELVIVDDESSNTFDKLLSIICASTIDDCNRCGMGPGNAFG